MFYNPNYTIKLIFIESSKLELEFRLKQNSSKEIETNQVHRSLKEFRNPSVSKKRITKEKTIWEFRNSNVLKNIKEK